MLSHDLSLLEKNMKDQNDTGDLKSEWILHRFLTEPVLSHYQKFTLKLSLRCFFQISVPEISASRTPNAMRGNAANCMRKHFD